ncbi:MAG: C40 family peptidase, partial [Clostridia bacterium]|nr:C40 family peptidase [Clostridia bacterium]
KLKTKPKMGAPKVLDKARNLSRSMRSAAQRAKDKASIDSDEYASPSEYAEHEIGEITNDGVAAARKTARKAAASAKKRIRRSMDKRRAKKQLSQEQSIDTASEIEVCDPHSVHEVPQPRTNGKRSNPANSLRGQQAYSESARTANHTRIMQRPKVAPKNTASTVRQAPARTVKTTSRTVNTTGKTVKATERAVVKTAEATKQTAQKTAQASKFAAQKAAAAAKAAAKVTVKAVQLTVKGVVAAGKAIASAVKGIVAAIAAGGWVAVVIIAAIAMIAAIVCSGFGIFFSNEGGGKTISEVIPTIERQFNSRITYDISQIPLGRHSVKKTVYVGDDDGDAPVNNWNDVIAVFSVLATTREEEPMDVVVLTDDAEALLSHVYNRMNSYTITTGSSGESGAYVLMCYVHRQALNYREGADLYDFNDNQREMLNEMMKPEYCEYYAQLLGINVTGDTDLNEIIDLLPDEKGAEVVKAALTKLGAPYVLGAKGDDKFDCSGLVYWAINEVDPDLGSHFWCCAADQAHYCENMTVEESELRPGDLVFWVNGRCSGCGRWNEIHHTGIYIGMGKVIEASSSQGRVVIRELWSCTNYPIFMFARPYN